MPTDNEITRQIAGTIAPLIAGGDWTVSTTNPEYPVAVLLGPLEQRITVRLKQGDTDRLTLHGTLPFESGSPLATITVGRFRGPKAIAGEINRRLLPEYQPKLADYIARRQAQLHAGAAREIAARELMDMWPKLHIGPSHMQSDSKSVLLADSVKLTLTHAGEQGEIELRWSSITEIKAVVSALAAAGDTDD